MNTSRCCLCKLFLTALIILLSHVPATLSQNTSAVSEQEEVVRINTELVQTDVMVFDKQGRFVNGLRRDDFELRIDGKPHAINSFDQVIAGSVSEDVQLSMARGNSSALKNSGTPPAPLDRGRIVFLFVDDLHLSPANLVSARSALLQYIENDMGQNDQAAIASTSGQLGFLQQLTDNKTVLHAAMERLKPRTYFVRDFERPPMNEYQALQVERNNREVIDHFVDELMKQMPSMPAAAVAQLGGLPRSRAEEQVRDRARLILQQAAVGTTNALSSLASLVHSAGQLPGRKLVFFISEGFFIDDRNSDSRERLRNITRAAASSGVVIYSMDARGLMVGTPDASSEAGPDPSGRLQRMVGSEIIESQDAMNSLAVDTGGRPFFNTNNFARGIPKALEETSAYYLIAWRPDSKEQKSDTFRNIEVSIINRPDLTVRMRRGFLGRQSAVAPKQVKTDKSNEAESAQQRSEKRLHAALGSPFPQRALPVSLSLAYVDTAEKGTTLTVALQVDAGDLSFNEQTDRKAALRIAGGVYNDEGKVGATLNDRLTVTAPSKNAAGQNARNLIYNYPVKVEPGLYQVRVAVEDEASGKTGSAQEWIEIPNLSKVPLALSSVIVYERGPAALPPLATPNSTPSESALLSPANVSVDHRFQRNSFMRLIVFLYSLPRPVTPDIVVQVQILRDKQPVLTTSQRKVTTEGIQDLTRLAYAAEISLEHLPPGRYILQINAIDRTTKAASSQQMRFQIQ